MSLRTTPFHARTGPLSEGQAWRRWAGYVVASSYELSHEREYHAIRNAVHADLCRSATGAAALRAAEPRRRAAPPRLGRVTEGRRTRARRRP